MSIDGCCERLDASGELVSLRPQADRMSVTLVARLNVSSSRREAENRTTQGDIDWQRVREKRV